ncbi:MAG: hypothetical protein J5689_01300 [Clostridia bacterium]|nr:hypothetical protein [Clostridia bacterium]
MENEEIDFRKILEDDKHSSKMKKRMKVSDLLSVNAGLEEVISSGNGWKIYLYAKENEKKVDVIKAGQAIVELGDEVAAFHFARRFKKELIKQLKHDDETLLDLRNVIANSRNSKYIFEFTDEFQGVKALDYPYSLVQYMQDKLCKLKGCPAAKLKFGLMIAGADQEVLSASIAKERKGDFIVECARAFKKIDLDAMYEGLAELKDAGTIKWFAKVVKNPNIPVLATIMAQTDNPKEMYEFARRYDLSGAPLKAIQEGLCKMECNPVLKPVEGEYIERFMRRFQDQKVVDLRALQDKLEQTGSLHWLIACAKEVKNSDKVSIAKTIIDMNNETSLYIFKTSFSDGEEYVALAKQDEALEKKR